MLDIYKKELEKNKDCPKATGCESESNFMTELLDAQSDELKKSQEKTKELEEKVGCY